MKQTNAIRSLWPWLLGIWLVLVLPGRGMGLGSSEILVVANRQSSEGVALARYYTRKRNIPETRLLLLNLPNRETCNREEYERDIALPIRNYLASVEPPERIRCLVLFFGMPLRVRPETIRQPEAVSALKDRQAALQKQIEDQKQENAAPDRTLNQQLERVQNKLNQLTVAADPVASVDSELMVVKAASAPIGGWIENPFYIGFRKRPKVIPREDVLMVSRLDGPTAASVSRIIDDTISTEKKGLSGIAYFDARWAIDRSANQSGYQLYDTSIHRAAQRVEKNTALPVHIDRTAALFQPGQCPEAALYCGWYSLARYVDAFTWQKGAVGYHIASGECTTLKKPDRQVWCKRMIEEGVCATLGPVGEPYVQAFPLPDVFFGFLTEGILSLSECYLVSLPFLSWKMVLIGDPLYHPFAAQLSR